MGLGYTTGQPDDSAPGGWLIVDWSTRLSTVITQQASLCSWGDQERKWKDGRPLET